MENQAAYKNVLCSSLNMIRMVSYVPVSGGGEDCCHCHHVTAAATAAAIVVVINL